ncbi:hypothetical protein MuYL_0133 [Mucilaginibacter xinganensis]|uniref:Uncharacterized protein n=1 Tax=Mucilaginibacter xinganensis TaxID=1234841 RepID=A0A223NQG0_9SPHI|nr:hypothetical protein MuYL_0133 [Mucilaginibacter xinganensis]
MAVSENKCHRLKLICLFDIISGKKTCHEKIIFPFAYFSIALLKQLFSNWRHF